ncbi:MAG: 50S ribosomal protein L9 [Victivallaceae bacterium]|nr:50S ribosomal protein L9 [Victivallaceae bacterium]
MAHVKLVLLEDVENLGLAGEEVSVAPGYARNYLVPRGFAMKANAATARILEARKVKIEQQRAAELAGAKALAEKLAGITVNFPVQASEDGQLFGSISARAIADKLSSDFGVEIEHSKIKLEDNIKALGTFVVDVKLHHDVTAQLSLVVVRG